MTDARGETVVGAPRRRSPAPAAATRVLGDGHDHHHPGLPPRLRRGRRRRRRSRQRRAAPARRWTRATRSTRRARRPRATRRSRRRASPRRRWSSGSRSSASAAPRRTRRSSTTIQDRGYVWKKGSALVPSFTAFAWSTLLEEHFPDLVDYAFTARMEDDLDDIANGDARAGAVARAASTSGRPTATVPAGPQGMVNDRLGEHRRPRDQLDPARRDADGVPIVARVGRYGPYLQRGEDNARSIPEDIAPDELTVEKALELLDAPEGSVRAGHRSRDRARRLREGRPVRPLRAARACTTTRAGTSPTHGVAVQDMTLETVTLDDALEAAVAAPVVGRRPGRRRGDHRAERQATGPTSRRAPTAAARPARSSCSRSRSTRRSLIFAEPKRRRGQGRPRRRCASSAPTPSPASRSW